MNLKRYLLTAALALASPGDHAVGQSNETQAQVGQPQAQITLPTGWEWEFEPGELHPYWRQSGFVRFTSSGALGVYEGPDGKVFAHHVRIKGLDLRGAEAPSYKVYVLDREGRELPATGSSTMNNPDLSIARSEFDTGGDPGRVMKVGLAVLTFEGRKKLAAAARQSAREAGATALPLPVLNRPYSFDLPTMDGGHVRSEELRGKVVLIDCWATWCGPCMAKMPELKRVYEQYADKGLVVIGVSFDRTPGAARKAIKEKGLDWTHVYADEAAKGIDDLWHDLTGITSIPRLFLIDRQGVLRGDFYPHDLEGKIKPLIEEPPRHR